MKLSGHITQAADTLTSENTGKNTGKIICLQSAGSTAGYRTGRQGSLARSWFCFNKISETETQHSCVHCFGFTTTLLSRQFFKPSLCVCVRLYSRVIVLDHLTHRPQGRQVLVQPIWTHEVERVWRARITVGAGEVDPHLQRSHSNASFFSFSISRKSSFSPLVRAVFYKLTVKLI